MPAYRIRGSSIIEAERPDISRRLPAMNPWPTNMQDSERRTPRAIDLDADNGLMRISWLDGHESLYNLPDLRRSCPCAGCAGEGNRAGTVDSTTSFTLLQTKMVEAQPLNRFGLQFVWGDGHDDGLFSYSMLRAMCPCDQCVAGRRSR